MKRTIWKTELAIVDVQEIKLPFCAIPLCVQMQGKTLCMWSRIRVVDEVEERLGDYRVWVCGTGNSMGEEPYDSSYVGTVQTSDGVWHIYLQPVFK